MAQLKVLDLFSGIGGFSLGLERTGGFETVAFCEIDPFCQKVLKKHWPDVPIYEDVRTLNYDGAVDVITGGYPCQPFSTAGKRKGSDDDRHLWPAMFSLIKKYRPAWVIGENVAGHISMGLDSVLSDLESADYTARTFIIPACALNAPHRRDRCWIVANAQGERERRKAGNISKKNGGQIREMPLKPDGAASEALPYCSEIGCQGEQQESLQWQSRESWKPSGSLEGWARGWPISSPRVYRVADGLPYWVDRNSALGNAVVPQIPEIIGHAILETEKNGTA